ncbi:MAG TPA: HD domain-containing phosphohydrolase [Patescibacteria group bacterium]|nr:HD domain-containing phosphohydrolase [Patescibacteria group bacterium]
MMQKLSSLCLQPHMHSAQNVYRSDGELLINAESSLCETLICKIREWGLGSLAIQHPLFKQAIPPELLPETDRVRAIVTLRELYAQIPLTGTVNLPALAACAHELLEVVRSRSKIMIHWGDLRTFDDYIYGHSVNVCILSLLVGIHRQLNDADLQDLALGALAHDLGLMKVSPDIMNKPGKLTAEEIRLSRKHTEFAFDILSACEPSLSRVAQLAVQHHENVDGSGYPHGVQGNDLPELSRIVAIANMYDALVTERPFRRAFLPHEACELLSTLVNRYLDPDLLDLFLSFVAIYPTGSVVRVNTGEIGIVRTVPWRNATRPLLDIITDNHGHLLDTPQPLDLAIHKKSFINKPLSDDEVIALLAPSTVTTDV